MPCRCNDNDIVNYLKDRIEQKIIPCLEKLNIFDTQNVFVYCLECRIPRQQNQCPEIIVTPISVRGCVVDKHKPGIYIVVGNPRLGSQCKQNRNQTCQTNSTIIDIGSSKNLLRRFGYFILELKYNFCGKLHSTAQRIRQAILNEYGSGSNTCLYIIGFPLEDNHKDKVRKVEGCFQEAHRDFFLSYPCCVDRPEEPDFNIFLIPPDEARRTIQFILTTIDIFFRDCIQDCSPL